MQPDNPAEIIATREFFYFDNGGEPRTIKVVIRKPQPSRNASDYECFFEINDLGFERRESAHGHDSLQALQSAMILAAATINHLNYKEGWNLRWKNGSNGDLGLP